MNLSLSNIHPPSVSAGEYIEARWQNMTDEIAYLIAAGISGWVLALVAIFRAGPQNRKDVAEAESAIAKSWHEIFTAVIDPLKMRVDELDRKVKFLEAENESLKEWAEGLFDQVIELGGKPKPYRRRKNE